MNPDLEYEMYQRWQNSVFTQKFMAEIANLKEDIEYAVIHGDTDTNKVFKRLGMLEALEQILDLTYTDITGFDTPSLQ